MEFERSAVNSAKTIARLEVKCDHLQRENTDLKEEVMEAKLREEEAKENMMEKWVKAKGKYKNVKEKFILEERKWKEENEKVREECRQLRVDKRKLKIDLEAATSSRADGSDDLAKKLKAAWDEVRALVIWLEEKDGTILFTQNESLVLTQRIQVLEEEKGQLEAEFRKVNEDNGSKDERICALEKVKEAEIRAMEDKGKKEVSELTCRIEALERDNRELEANFRQVNMEKSEEINRILNEAKSEEIKRILNEKRTMEAESEVKVLELVQRIDELEREKRANEAKVCQADIEKNEEISRILNEKIVIEVDKTTMEEESKKKVSEVVRRIEVLERVKSEEIERILNEKTTMEAESELKVLELVRRIEELEKEKRENEAKVCQADKEKSEEISSILNEKMAVEAEKTTMEMKVLELVRKIEALERENKEINAEVFQAKKEKSGDIKRILDDKMVVEAEKEKMEAEGKKKVLELVQRIDVLEREKREMEAEVCREKNEKSEEISRILNEKMAVEAEKTSMETESKEKILELVRRNEALEMEIEAEVYEAKKKREKIRRILNEKTPLQEKHEKRILGKEKQGVEAETGNNYGVVQVLAEDCSVDNNTKRMETETKRSIDVRSEEEEELTPQAHPASNFCILGLPASQDQGSQSESDDVFVAEPNKERSLVDVQVRWEDGHVVGSERLFWGRARTRSQKRKIEALECSLANKARTK